MSISIDDYKKVLGSFATGVTIVTSRVGERVHGMTVSAFTEVSLDPPLVLVCADVTSNTQPLIAEGKVFAVNILARDQDDLSNRFASKKDEDKRFDGLDYETGETGAPMIAGAVASLDCRVVAVHDAGDHVIYIGEVQDLRVSDRDPLLYLRGSYGSFSES